MNESDRYNLSETIRQLHGITIKGTVEQVDYIKARLKIRSGNILTGWIPWTAIRAGKDRDWAAYEIGEQVLVLNPSGDPANGVVLGAIFQDLHPQNANTKDIRRTTYEDGAVIEYNKKDHVLSANLPANSKVNLVTSGGELTINLSGGKTVLTSTGGVTIKGDIDLEGNITQKGDISQTGKITSSGDHMAGLISLQRHVHVGVQSGNSVTGLPQ